MPDWFFTSDLHGQTAYYEQLLAIVAARRPRVVILGGDLCPHAGGGHGIGLQRAFLEGFLVEFARRAREANRDTHLMLLMGNDDWGCNHDCLERHHGDLWLLVHGRAVVVDDVRVAGLSWVPITPFKVKDWERWDDGDFELPGRLDGFVSRDGDTRPYMFDAARRSPTIADALAELATATPAADTVLIAHSPPSRTHCDVVANGAHVGSRALRRFIEANQPPLTLSGHIHESPRTSGAWHDRIGDTVVVNPGQFGTSRLCGVWFDPAHPGESLRHTVHP